MRFMNIKVIGISLSLLLSFQVAWAQKQANSKSNIVQEQSKDASSNVIKRRVLTKDLQNNNEVYYFNNQPYTGTSIDLFDNKTKMQEINWKDGLLHGDKTEYFLGGNQVRAKLAFNMGKRNGPFVYYHENGNIQLIGKYINDEIVYQGANLAFATAQAIVHDYVPGQSVEVYRVQGNFTTGILKGNTSTSTSRTINVISDTATMNNAFEDIFDNARIEAASDGIIDFTEQNPFGEP